MKQKITCKMCRREGVSICGRAKCAVLRRPFAPGVHGPTSRARPTAYGLQLREKQKARRSYGITEKQFSNYFRAAAEKTGDTGEILMRALEMRLDNAVYRLGFAKTRRQARQLVNHGHFLVNGKSVDIPSFAVRPGQEISVREKSKSAGYFKELHDALGKASMPSWLKIDAATMTATVLTAPEAEDLKQTVFDPKLIVEFYSR